MFGSRNLTWKHLPIFSSLADCSMQASPLPVDVLLNVSLDLRRSAYIPENEPLVLLNGDGPPGKTRGAVGADKLALLACMSRWPERRRVRWFPPEPQEGETWPQAAGRRNREMVEARPDRAYCVHTDLDSSKGSRMTADLLTAAGLNYWYVRVSEAGAVLEVTLR